MTTLFHSMRQACRTLGRQPLLVVAAAGILAVGSAGSATVFSLFNALLLRQLPIPHAQRVVHVSQQAVQRDGEVPITDADLALWREHNGAFEVLAGFMWGSIDIALLDGQAESLSVFHTTHDVFDLFGVQPAMGRCFTSEEDRLGSASVAMLGFDFWHRQWGGASDVVGKAVQLNGKSLTIVGVLPPNAVFPEKLDLWVPLAGNPERFRLMVLGRLKPGISCSQAREDLTRLARAETGSLPRREDVELSVVSARTCFTGDYRRVSMVFAGAVGLLLLIACCNVSGLLLARSVQRSRELGIRAAMGATRTQILWQAMIESLILSVLGAAAGFLLSRWLLTVLLAFLADQIPAWASFAPDGGFLLFGSFIVVGTAVLSGLLPAWNAAEGRHILGLIQAGGSRSTAPRSQRRILHALAAGEIALALTLLVGAGLLGRAFLEVLRVDPGFRTRDTLVYTLAAGSGCHDRAQFYAFFQDHLDQVRALPGVRNAALIYGLPLKGGGDEERIVVEGGRQTDSGSEPGVLKHLVSPSYFETMAVRLTAGRVLTHEDVSGRGDLAAVVNESLARHYWPAESPLGKRLRFADEQDAWFRVVGVTRDVRHKGLEQAASMEFYVPCTPETCDRSIMGVVVHTSTSPQNLMPPIRRIIKEADPTVPAPGMTTMSSLVDEYVHFRRMYTWVFGVFAAAAGILAVGGTYGVMAYSTSQRTQEVGIRLVLGARPRDITRQMLRQGMFLTGTGLLLGLAGALVLGRVLSSLLFGVGATDPVTFLGVSALLLIVSCLACWLPARRAARVDPMVVLRCE